MKGDLGINKMEQKKAIKQLMAIRKMGKDLRLAADGWPLDWQTLIATLMSARTTDKITIPIAQRLFDKYDNIKKLANAKYNEIALIIRGVNFYKTKTKHIIELAKILVGDYKGLVPHDFNKLIELPGVGRKTANVFLAEKGHGRIGVDTHVSYISQQMGWTKSDKQEIVERDLEGLFPERLWGDINWILVRFGQTYPSRAKKREILNKIKGIK
jgi:endonuclease-3